MGNSEIKDLTTKYRDIFRLQRETIIEEYAKKNVSEGEMYYIYDKNSEDENKLNATVYGNGRIGSMEVVDRKELPEGTKVEDVLIKKDTMFFINEEATNNIAGMTKELIKKLLKEQEEELNKLRVENHIYEVSGVGIDRIWLFDITNESETEREENEETNINEDILKNVEVGNKLIYKDGSYEIINRGE